MGYRDFAHGQDLGLDEEVRVTGSSSHGHTDKYTVKQEPNIYDYA